MRKLLIKSSAGFLLLFLATVSFAQQENKTMTQEKKASGNYLAREALKVADGREKRVKRNEREYRENKRKGEAELKEKKKEKSVRRKHSGNFRFY